ERILGRVTVHDIYDPMTDELICPANAEITDEIAKKIEDTNIEEVEIRSLLTCESRVGGCAKCYGRNLATGKMVHAGEAVGVIAAQSIGEPGTQLTLRTFHVGGTASNIAVEANIKAKFNGIVEFEGVRFIETTDAEGNPAREVMGRTGENKRMARERTGVHIADPVPKGPFVRVGDAARVEKGGEVCFGDLYSAVILSASEATVR